MSKNNQNNHSQNYFLNLLNSEDFINSFQEQCYSPSPSYINGFSVTDDTEPAIPIFPISDHNYQPQYDPTQLIPPFAHFNHKLLKVLN